jgi:hypothetical protein
LSPGQPPKEIEDLKVVQASEPWSEYTLEDGTLIRAKIVLVGIGRVVGELDEAGNQRYAMKATLIVHPEPAQKGEGAK